MQLEKQGHPPITSETILVIKGFRAHLLAVADPAVLDLLYLAQIRPVTNSDVRAAFRLQRSGAYKRLNALRELGLLEERDHAYRTSEYGARLTDAVIRLFKAAMGGNWDQPETIPAQSRPNPRALKELLTIAREGTESLYGRGRLTRESSRLG